MWITSRLEEDIWRSVANLEVSVEGIPDSEFEKLIGMLHRKRSWPVSCPVEYIWKPESRPSTQYPIRWMERYVSKSVQFLSWNDLSLCVISVSPERTIPAASYAFSLLREDSEFSIAELRPWNSWRDISSFCFFAPTVNTRALVPSCLEWRYRWSNKPAADLSEYLCHNHGRCTSVLSL